MQLSIDIEKAGKVQTVSTKPADIVAWEQHTGRSVAGWGDTPPSYTDICYLAFRADTRSKPGADFDGWLLTIDSVTLSAMEAENPTQTAATAG